MVPSDPTDSSNGNSSLRWMVCSFDDLPRRWLYRLLQARQEVFTIEQHVICQDLDDLDFEAQHVLCVDGDRVAAYARVLAAGTRYDEPSFGRVLTTTDYRGIGLGKALVRRCVQTIETLSPDSPSSRISAQLYLKDFYAAFGYVPFGDVYLEDAIDHIAMRRIR
ncbi:putative acyltransferase [Crateriforma conspicua]|uniref:Putative acyltransferase n=1 Tax=Crateriforma conspicua TaxID=2527996 RepID=A0A5C6G160_9PLAN|nr:putative acyltransferase [Crateriforma conspicua]